MTRLFAVVTTVQPPTAAMRRMAQAIARLDGQLVVAGDRKGPERYPLDGVYFLSLADQQALPFRLGRLLPVDHYARKNLGYLCAIAEGAPCIYETDDDNAPLECFAARSLQVEAQPVAPRSWFNVYRAFSDELLWPRGFPLALVRDGHTHEHDPARPLERYSAPLQQALHDGSPDADAVWRLTLEHEVVFERRPSLWLPPGTWSPINSQSTWWWPPAYPLLYLPSHASAQRMPDIWRGFIAQRCLWETGHGLVFHASEVHQQRNDHDYLHDFELELGGYLGNQALTERLANLALDPGPPATGANLLRCYEALVEGGWFDARELPLVAAWLDDIERLT